MKKIFQLGPQFHGHVSVLFAWQPGEQLVASIGEGQRNMFLFDRRGVQVEEVALKSTAKVLQLEWDREGEMLAILQQGEGTVMLWRRAEKKLEVLEMNTKDPSFLCWSKVGPQLVIGTAKGNLMIYNKKTLKKQTIMGKHTKTINCGAWHPQDNIFACGSEDKTITLSGEDGDSIMKGEEPLRLKCEPSLVQFAGVRGENPNESNREKVVSVVLGESSLLLCSMREPQRPTELSFQAKYGAIRGYCWFGDGFLIIGFSSGFVVVISSQMREMREEISSVKYHGTSLDAICCSKAAGKIAAAGDDGIKIISTSDFKEIKNERITYKPEGRVTSMHWSEDGELLSFSTDGGWVYCYLAKITALSATCDNRLAYLTSLREVTVIEGNDQGSRVVVPTDMEPAFLALGPSHMATGMNNRVWFYYSAQQSGVRLVTQQEYIGSVESVSLNSTHACVLIEGRVYLHPIERITGGDGKTTIFPRQEGDRSITSASIVGNFLIYAQSSGRLQYYSLVDGTEVNEYIHENGIKRCYPNQEGTRCVLIDVTGSAWLYNPVNDDCVPIQGFPMNSDRVLWDTADSTIFVAADQKNLFTFIYTQVEVGGSGVRCLGNVDLGTDGELRIEPVASPLAHGQVAVLLIDGLITCQQSSGSLSQQRLRTHELLTGIGGIQPSESVERQKTGFKLALGLNRFQLAFKTGLVLNSKEHWIAMGRRCLECLDIGWARKAYRQARSPGMVLYLERLLHVEDKQLLSGHVAALFGRFGKAREYFLQSCSPEAALEMHCDFQQWDQALTLAQSLAPWQLPDIYLKSATKLENQGEHQSALAHFEQAMKDVGPDRTDHLLHCQAGIARTSIRTGDLQKGMQVAMNVRDPTVFKECAHILKTMHQNGEAAQLYEEAGAYDKAAELYIYDKMFEAAAPLMSKIHTPKLHYDFAKAKEARGAYSEALTAFKNANDLDNVVRLYLEKLNDPTKAFALVRDTPFVSGAERVAEYCRKNGNVPGAVEFLLLAKNDEEAYNLAERHDEMETYEKGIGDGGTREQHTVIAKYYEQRNLLSNAAKHYALADEYSIALKLYLRVGEKEIDNAIEVVGKARTDTLTHTLIDYLMGESDNVPKNANYVYRLHKALGNYMQAAGTALIIAKQDQDQGNYKQAHDILLSTHQDLQWQKLKFKLDHWDRLATLHSYVIVKPLVRAGDHYHAALMLLRVARNITQFPMHVVPILTSTVIECQRAKLSQEAYQYSCVLMRPEYRPQVAEQYKKKIENIVRKPCADAEGAVQEAQSPCMYCDAFLGDSQLDCKMCKNISPFCIVTGMRMLKDDWTYCPTCNFPAKRTAFVNALQANDQCTMCEAHLKPEDLPLIEDPSALIAEYKTLFHTIDPT